MLLEGLAVIYVMGLISVVVSAILVRPLLRRGSGVIVRDPLADAIGEYERRLADLDRDVAKGTIAAEDADLARTEIGRQLLRERKALEKQDGERQSPPDIKGGAIARSSEARRLDIAILIMIALIPVGAALIYWQLGSPGFADQPLAKRLAQASLTPQSMSQSTDATGAQPPLQERNTQLQSFVAQLEARLTSDSEDAQGWALLARSYEALEETDKAHQAWLGLLRADPDHSDGLWLAGVNAVKRGKPEEARPLWTALREQYETGSQDYDLITQALATLDAPNQDTPNQ